MGSTDINSHFKSCWYFTEMKVALCPSGPESTSLLSLTSFNLVYPGATSLLISALVLAAVKLTQQIQHLDSVNIADLSGRLVYPAAVCTDQFGNTNTFAANALMKRLFQNTHYTYIIHNKCMSQNKGSRDQRDIMDRDLISAEYRSVSTSPVDSGSSAAA